MLHISSCCHCDHGIQLSGSTLHAFLLGTEQTRSYPTTVFVSGSLGLFACAYFYKQKRDAHHTGSAENRGWLRGSKAPPCALQPVCRVDRAHTTTASSPTATLLASCPTRAHNQGPRIPRSLPALSRDSAASGGEDDPRRKSQHLYLALLPSSTPLPRPPGLPRRRKRKTRGRSHDPPLSLSSLA